MFDTVNNLSGILAFFAFTAFFCIIYQLMLRTWFYFSDRNVKFVRGLPFIGSTYRSFMGLESAAITFQRCYERYPNEKFIGLFDFGGKPAYLIRDCDVIKQLMTTDSDNFVNHKFSTENQNDLFGHTLFSMKDERWQKMCATASPAFTSSQLRLMYDLVVKRSECFVQQLKDDNKIAKLFNSRHLFSRYANDIIASAAFGTEMDSMRESEKEFFRVGAKFSKRESRYLDSIKFLASLYFPSLVKSLDIRVTEDKTANFMQKILKRSVSEPGNGKMVRNDMIDLLVKAQDGKLQYGDSEDKTNIGLATAEESIIGKSSQKIQNGTDDDMVTQCMVFFLGGFNSISSAACFMFHELAINPDIQEQLFREIMSVKNDLNGQSLTFETIPKLKYLDMVVSETLRRWPTVPFIERTCNQTQILENSDGNKLQLNVGDTIVIPAYAIHMDEKNFSNAEKFDPERFSDNNKDSIESGTYLPFGIGSRNSIGSQFAIAEIKTLTYYLLSEFHIDKSARTQDPIELKALPYTMDAEKGFYIELRRRHPDHTPFKSKIFTY